MAIVQKITPCLWFDLNAEEAAMHYTATFPDSKILMTSRYGDGAQLPKGTVMMIEFALSGQKFQALNGGPVHATFSEAISLSVRCEGQAEVDHYWERLGEGGKPSRCGWLKDKFGLSWQIVPTAIGELMSSGDGASRQRVMGALMTMSKIDIAALLRARDGGV